MVEVGEGRLAVTDGGMDVPLDRRPRPHPDLGRLDPARAGPSGEEVEEVDPGLDEGAPAPGAVPEPVLGRQVLVGGVVLEGPVQDFTQGPIPDEPTHGLEQGVVPLHEIGDEQTIPLPRGGDPLVGLLDRQGERLLDDPMLAGLQGRDRLFVVEERRGGDVHQIHFIPPEELADPLDVLDPEPIGRGQRRGPMGGGHANELDSRDLGELLEGEQPEPAAPDDGQANVVVHESWPRHSP